MASRLGRRNVHGATLRVSPTSVSDWASVCSLIRRADAVLSLLPAPMHAAVGRACLDARVPLVTASYVSTEMAQLHSDAARLGVPVLCEMGLDPGIGDWTPPPPSLPSVLPKGTCIAQVFAAVTHCSELLQLVRRLTPAHPPHQTTCRLGP